MDYFAGLDVSLEKTHIRVVDRDGGMVHEATATSSPAAVTTALTAAPACRRVVFETGRMAPMLYHGLVELGVPVLCIESRQAELERLGEGASSAFAQKFIVSLLGDRHGSGARFGAFRNVEHLKSLYVLMHRHIRAADDIDRANKGVYSPTLRDDAQDARNRLFQILSDIPGAETYAAIKALENEHPDPGYRRWMALRARQRAIADADELVWTASQVHEFASQFEAPDRTGNSR